MNEEIHDTSRMDAFLATRRRTMLLHAAWRPMLAGAVGAALIIGAVWVATPKFVFHDIDLPRVTMRDVTVDHVIPKDVEVPHIIEKDVIMPVPLTPEEKKFTDSPEYKAAIYHGRIIPTKDGRSITFEDGQSFSPAHWDGTKAVTDTDRAFDTDALVGDLAMCVQNEHELWLCTAMHNGHVVDVHAKPYTAPVVPAPQSAPVAPAPPVKPHLDI